MYEIEERTKEESNKDNTNKKVGEICVRELSLESPFSLENIEK